MRLKKSTSKNAVSYYAIRSIYISPGKTTSEIVRKFGTHDFLLTQDLGGLDPEAWCRKEIEIMNAEEEDGKVFFALDSKKRIGSSEKRCFNAGQIFLRPFYYGLGLDKLSRKISAKHKFDYDLDAILSMLVCSRILFPASKRSSLEDSQRFMDLPVIQEHQVYRALDVLAEHSDEIQAGIYKNSLKISDRNTRVLYFDCTNFFFEMDEAEGYKQYGISKQHQPKPLVQMGLFTDANGIPLAFDLTPGNTNENKTLKPLEQKILKDFGCAEFVVCTDAGLSSLENRVFNTKGSRAFITTQSVKKLKQYLKDWALSDEAWKLSGDDKLYKLSELDEEQDYDKVFYKERWMKEKDFEQRLVVSYSLKYRNYQRELRQGQVERAATAIHRGGSKLGVSNPNDYRRFMEDIASTEDGEIADNRTYLLNEQRILQEAQYDGFYAICTNLEEDIQEVLAVNKRRWQIEACFRVMKNDFKSRPVYVRKDHRIYAHFLTCFIALLIFRLLEQKVKEHDQNFTATALIETLRNMELTFINEQGYVPHYERTALTDALHEIFAFTTDNEVITTRQMKEILKTTKRYYTK